MSLMSRKGSRWLFRCVLLLRLAALMTLAMAGGNRSVQADTILAYTPDNSPDSSPAVDVATGLTPLPLTRGEGLGAGTGNTFNSSGWTDEPTDYLQWGWSASVPIDLIDLDLRYDRSNSGPSVVDIQLAVDGGAYASVFNDSNVSTSGEDVLDVDLSTYQNVTSATFRLFGSNASTGGGTFDIEPLSGIDPPRGIIVSGSVASVPEPSGFCLAMMALCGGYVMRRRQT